MAYKQPVIRAVIEKIRGVGSDSSIAKLMERGLIYESGRLDIPGRPITYSTTDEFLRCMGYSSLADLPPFPDTEETPDEQMSLTEEMFPEAEDTAEQPTELPKLD